MTRLIQITDTHLQANPQARSRTGYPLFQFERVVEQAQRQRPDAIIVTGDISQDGSSDSYRWAVEILNRLACPWYWLAGNHDDSDIMAAYREIIPEIELSGRRLLMLETRVAGKPHGRLGSVQVKALAAQLQGEKRSTWLVMHHPPVAIGSAWMDAIGLEDRQALWQCLADFPQVQGILCGHIHQAYTQSFSTGGSEITVYGCPATSDQFLPDAAEFAVDESSRPGYRIVDLEDTTFNTWIERVDVQASR